MEQITHLSSGIPGIRLIDAEHNRLIVVIAELGEIGRAHV